MMGQRWRCCHAARPRPRCHRWFWTHRLGSWLLRPLHAALRVRRPNVRFAHLCVHRLHRAGIHRALHFPIQSPLDSPDSPATDSHTAKSARCLSSPPTVDLLHSASPTKSASSKPLQRVLRRAPKPNLSRPRGRLANVVTLVLRRLKALFGLAQSAVCYQHVRDGARRCRGSVQPSRRGPKDRGARGAGSPSGKAKVRRERSIYNPQCQYICPPGASPLIFSINLINHH